MAETAAVVFGALRTAERDACARDGQPPAEGPAALLSMLPAGRSAAIRHVNQLIGQVALFDSNVLLLGESGTGKEVAARAIHETSPRRRRPFVPINCGAIPAELLESELFGHERGAFTGALAARKGRFEIAEGGTIFLDEIGDMNPTMQVKLLRVLQERVFERVGSCVSQRCDVRIIAATHRNLEDAISKGTFREDLYYRLNVVPIDMPPLRERGEDLPELIEVLAERIAAAGRPRVQFTAAALAALRVYRWPGNVRELSNLIERMAVQCGARAVSVADLPLRYRPPDWDGIDDTPGLFASVPALSLVAAVPTAATAQSLPQAWLPAPETDDVAADTAQCAVDAIGEEPPPMDPVLTDLLLERLPQGFDLRGYLESLEQQLIMRAMQSAGGTVAQAARLLGLRRTTLVEKLRKYAPDAAAPPATET